MLGLGFGSDKENFSASFNDGLQSVIGKDGAFDRFVQVDEVDAVAGAVDETAHLRVPTTGLMSEVNSVFQALLDRDDRGVGIVEDFRHISGFHGFGFFSRCDRFGDRFLFDFVTHFGDLHLFMPPSLRTTDHQTHF